MADAPSRSRDLTEADRDALQRAQGLFDEGVSLDQGEQMQLSGQVHHTQVRTDTALCHALRLGLGESTLS